MTYDRLNYLTVKPASGYHYKNLAVAKLGRIKSVKAISYDDLPLPHPLRVKHELFSDKRRFYRVVTEKHFVLYTDRYLVLLANKDWRTGWQSHSAILVNSKKGETFVALVETCRVADICFTAGTNRNFE